MRTVSGAWLQRSRAAILGGFLFFAIGADVPAQERSLDQLPGLRERAVRMHVVSRVVEQNKQVVWDSENTSITIPGRPVGLKLVGTDVVVQVQFTPFLRPNGQYTLVALGQIWINVPGEGLSFQTTMQTIPLEFGETIYFFPLGEMVQEEDAHIEIQLILEPFDGRNGTRVRQDHQEAPHSTNSDMDGIRINRR